MSPIITRVTSDEVLPHAVDVVVVGAGIVGCASAYYLAKRGLSVALLDKGYVGCEQSSRSWAWCRQQNRDLREMPLSLLSMSLWDNLAAEIGRDVGFRRCGLVYATDDEKTLAQWDSWRDIGRQFNINTRMLTAAEAAEKVPETRRKWVGGLHNMDDGKAEPELAVPALAEAARAHGATIHQDCAARSLDFANRRVVGVHTEKGYIRTGAVLCAAGAWASRFLRPHGARFPQASVRQTVVRTKPTANVGEVVYCPDVAMTRRLDGSYTLAISGKAVLELTPQAIRFAPQFMPQFIQRIKAVRLGLGQSFLTGPDSAQSLLMNDPMVFEKNRVCAPPPMKQQVNAILENVRSTFPQLADVEMDMAWGAYVDCTPDSVPVLSEVDDLGGVFVAAGCSGHGFGVGPGIGLLMSQMISGDALAIDKEQFRLSRLNDGSRIKVGAL